MNETDVQIMLAKAPLKLPEPDAAAVRAAELALKGHQAVEEQWRRDIDRDVWRWRWIEVKEKVKGLFVSSGGTNSPSGPSARSQGEKLKPVPLALALLVVVGVGSFTFRWFRKRRYLRQATP